VGADQHVLDAVFGPGTAQTAEARARESTRMFVRSLDQLAEDSPRATGLRLTASQAFEAYGLDKLQEVTSEGSALLASSADAAGLPLRTRRLELGLDVKTVARRAGVAAEVVEACENSRRQPIRTYEQIGRALGLDERYVAVSRTPKGNEQLTVRLRRVGDDIGALGPAAVSALAEAAWVASTQSRLARALGQGVRSLGLSLSPNYGTPGFPPYRWGYELARQAREALKLDPDSPITSMRDIVEDSFGIPLIQCDLGESIAGATIDSEGNRAIVVNRSGGNCNAFMRRTTMAHELGHILFDPPSELDILRVDEFDDLSRHAEQVADRVEQRANAFAVEFLAPQRAVLAMYQQTRDVVATVERYGLGQMPVRHQIQNASGGEVVVGAVRLPTPNTEGWQRFAAWEGAESFAIDFHPLSGLRPSRAGRFCAVVVRAAQEGIVSWDTASSWLEAPETAVRDASESLRALFPSVWGLVAP
jgi:hypothetical protein